MYFDKYGEYFRLIYSASSVWRERAPFGWGDEFVWGRQLSASEDLVPGAGCEVMLAAVGPRGGVGWNQQRCGRLAPICLHGKRCILMIANEWVLARAQAYLDDSGMSLRVTVSGEFLEGWYFCFQSKEFLETGDLSAQLAGNAPFLIDRDSGELRVLGTAEPLQTYLDDYVKEKMVRRANGVPIGETLGPGGAG